MTVRILLRDGESIQEAVRRFRRQVNQSGLRRQLRQHAYFEKPGQKRRRKKGTAKLRAARWNYLCGGYTAKRD